MKLFKKNIALFIAFLLIISAGTTNVSASSLNLNENVAHESFSYIDFGLDYSWALVYSGYAI